MSAAEKLRALDGSMAPAPWQIEPTGEGRGEWPPHLQDTLSSLWAYYLSQYDDEFQNDSGVVSLRNALPLIADVVHQAEALTMAGEFSRDAQHQPIRFAIHALRDSLETSG